MKVDERELSYQARKKLPKGEFVFPKEKRYPIHDKPHARNALARVSAHGTPSEKAKVRAAVHSKYPDIGESWVLFAGMLQAGKVLAQRMFGKDLNSCSQEELEQIRQHLQQHPEEVRSMMQPECQVPPLGPEERAELYEAAFTCTIRGPYGPKPIVVNAADKTDAIVQCMRQTGKRPSEVIPVEGTEAPVGGEAPLHLPSAKKTPYEPHSLGKLRMAGEVADSLINGADERT